MNTLFKILIKVEAKKKFKERGKEIIFIWYPRQVFFASKFSYASVSCPLKSNKNQESLKCYTWYMNIRKTSGTVYKTKTWKTIKITNMQEKKEKKGRKKVNETKKRKKRKSNTIVEYKKNKRL